MMSVRSSVMRLERGVVESVQFLESAVGLASCSVVCLRPHDTAKPRWLMLAGDVRNSLPAGKKVELSWRPGDGLPVLVSVSHP
jgi:hypothetical protein